MSTDYVIPMCPGANPGADWQEMGWCCHACAAMAHIAWCPNHDPDEPVPLTLTPKAHAALNQAVIWLVDECPADGGPADEWACVICGDAYFGTRPADERCPGCRDDG